MLTHHRQFHTSYFGHVLRLVVANCVPNKLFMCVGMVLCFKMLHWLAANAKPSALHHLRHQQAIYYLNAFFEGAKADNRMSSDLKEAKVAPEVAY